MRHLKVIKIVVEAAAGRIPVIAGTGSNSTSEAVYLTKEAAKLGVSGALLVCPYYNKPTQEGLYLHYRKVAEEADVPQIVYNVAKPRQPQYRAGDDCPASGVRERGRSQGSVRQPGPGQPDRQPLRYHDPLGR